jgi:transketolase N-terminal domain/subunit
MKETFTKINDYTLRQTLEEPKETISAYSDFQVYARITRIFNFEAAQLTATTRDMVLLSRGSEAGGSTAVSTQTTIQNFEDIQSGAEIARMHKKLKDLGGKPPALESFTGGLGKKPSGLTPRKTG